MEWLTVPTHISLLLYLKAIFFCLGAVIFDQQLTRTKDPIAGSYMPLEGKIGRKILEMGSV
jgi:hypothetical protein